MVTTILLLRWKHSKRIEEAFFGYVCLCLSLVYLAFKNKGPERTKSSPNPSLWGAVRVKQFLGCPGSACAYIKQILVVALNKAIRKRRQALDSSLLGCPGFVYLLDGRGWNPWFGAWQSWSNDGNNIPDATKREHGWRTGWMKWGEGEGWW